MEPAGPWRSRGAAQLVSSGFSCSCSGRPPGAWVSEVVSGVIGGREKKEPWRSPVSWRMLGGGVAAGRGRGLGLAVARLAARGQAAGELAVGKLVVGKLAVEKLAVEKLVVEKLAAGALPRVGLMPAGPAADPAERGERRIVGDGGRREGDGGLRGGAR